MRENVTTVNHVEVPEATEVQSALHVRLRSLAENLPEQGSVTFTRHDLFKMIEDRGQVDGTDQYSVDLTVAEVADMFDRNPQTIRDWIKSGQLRGYLFNGREYRVPKAAVEEYQESQRVTEEPSSATKVIDLAEWRDA